jgi:RNA polymerase sigma-54 factor
MSNKMLVTVKMDQRLKMSQQLRQAITLLQYNSLDLKQLVQHYLETNPLLDAEEESESSTLSTDESDDHTQYSKISAHQSKRGQIFEDENSLENFSVPKSLRDHLLDQTLLCQFNKIEQAVAEAIIDAIDENGYLTMSLHDIKNTIDDTHFLEDKMLEEVLKTIQTFDPIGVGSRDIRECLLIQLNNLSHKNAIWTNAYKIVCDAFELMTSNDTKNILKMLKISQQDYKNARALIQTLNPHPGIQYSSNEDLSAQPELYVKKIKNTWQVFLTDSILTTLKINNQYQSVIKQSRAHQSYQALKQELEEARGLLKGLKRRNDTLLAVASFIMEIQKDFLDHGLTHMKGMNIADVALALNLHESTISRITTGKYIATPRGVFELKYFFPSSVGTISGDMCSATAVKAYIKEIINQETHDHILSDSEIASLLKDKGIRVARRTISKYRESMKILPSYQRMKTPSVAEE